MRALKDLAFSEYLLFMRSEIVANLNVLEFVEIFGEICKTGLGVRWSNHYGVTAPLQRFLFTVYLLGITIMYIRKQC